MVSVQVNRQETFGQAGGNSRQCCHGQRLKWAPVGYWMGWLRADRAIILPILMVPVVRITHDGVCELLMMRWGLAGKKR
ncbi:MAG: hypothetical protein AB7Q04_03805 [Steroidobacteraceae bacterium]